MSRIRERVVCNNGVSLSVQASEGHYCFPRDGSGPYFEVEVGYIETPSKNKMIPPSEWKEYSDGDFPSSVYGYVPIDMVQSFIESNGGIKSGDMPLSALREAKQ